MSSFSEVFKKIYDNEVWGGGSGPGSEINNIRSYIIYLQGFIDACQIKSIVDCGCGDWQSTRYLKLNGVKYLGIDIVPSVIEANVKAYGTADIQFECSDFIKKDLPGADLLICKDVLQHLPDEAVFEFLLKLKNFRYAILTNDEGDNSLRNYYLLNSPYYYAPISLDKAPFSLRCNQSYYVLGNKVTHFISDTKQSIEHSSRQEFSTLAGAQKVISKKVLIAILAKQKAEVLPFYLKCLEALNYPKENIAIYIRTNNNSDNTADILKEWVARNYNNYAKIEMDETDVADEVQQFGVHEWNEIRFTVLGKIRQNSLAKTLELGCDYYFVADVDNFLRPDTLINLVMLNLPIVGPLLKLATEETKDSEVSGYYSNYHYEVDANGYYADSPQYYSVWEQTIKGIIEVKVIHCTYLIRADVISYLSYLDNTGRHEYVIFSESARRHGIKQYIDNREIYGFLTFDENSVRAEEYLGFEVNSALIKNITPK